MKVCFIATAAYPLFNPDCRCRFGGAEVQMFQLAVSLAHDPSFEVHFVVADHGQKNEVEYGSIRVHKSFKLGTTCIVPTNCFSPTRIIDAFRFVFILNRIDADVYIQRCAGVETGLTRFISRVRRKRFIYMTAHDVDCNGEYITTSGLRGRCFRYGLENADAVITQTEHHKELLKKHHRIESVVLPTGYEIQPLHDSEPKFILWVGRIERWKQPECCLALARRFPEQAFMMVGPRSCPDEDYQRFLNEAGSVENVTYLDGVGFKDIDEYFRSAFAVLNTSRYEGFPNTFVQAMKHGVPVVSLNVDPDNILSDHGLGFRSGCIDQMAEDLRTLISDPGLYQRMSQNAYSYAQEHHDITKVMIGFKGLIERYTPRSK